MITTSQPWMETTCSMEWGSSLLLHQAPSTIRKFHDLRLLRKMCQTQDSSKSSTTEETTGLSMLLNMALFQLWLQRIQHRTSLLLSPTAAGWNDMMQYVHYKSHPGKSSVLFLRMIDMSSSDLSCIFSTLNYIAQHAGRYASPPSSPSTSFSGGKP